MADNKPMAAIGSYEMALPFQAVGVKSVILTPDSLQERITQSYSFRKIYSSSSLTKLKRLTTNTIPASYLFPDPLAQLERGLLQSEAA